MTTFLALAQHFLHGVDGADPHFHFLEDLIARGTLGAKECRGESIDVQAHHFVGMGADDQNFGEHILSRFHTADELVELGVAGEGSQNLFLDEVADFLGGLREDEFPRRLIQDHGADGGMAQFQQ